MRRLIAEKETDGEGPSVSKQGRRVLVLTDGCLADTDKLLGMDDTQVIGVGKHTGNVAITSFQVRRSLVNLLEYQILIEVVNHSDEEVKFRLTITRGDTSLEVHDLKLPANEKWSKVFPKTSADGGVIMARLHHADALVSDNEAVAILPKRETKPVLLVSETSNLFVAKVLEANPLVQLGIRRKLPETTPAGTVMVYHRQVPTPLPPGNALVIDPANDCDLWTVGARLQNPLVAKQDKESPLMAHVRLDNVLMPEVRQLTFTPAAANRKSWPAP